MNESKSQQQNVRANKICGCYKYQNINERKQITTDTHDQTIYIRLLQISEYQ